jgi:hypothetical protein
LLVATSCTPALTPPRESLRVSGTVEDVPESETSSTDESTVAAAAATPASTAAQPAKTKTPPPLQKFPTLHHLPLGVAIYEACSSQLYFFKRCPGRFLGEAKLANPGPFVVEIDTTASAIVVFGFRGFLDPEQQQEACAEAKIPIAEISKPVTLKLESGTCSIKLEKRYG